MIVNAARDDALALAQWTRYAQLGGDSIADKSASIRQLIEQIGQLFFHFESNHFGLGLFACHAIDSDRRLRLGSYSHFMRTRRRFARNATI